MFGRLFVACAAISIGAVACSSTTEADPGGSSGTPGSSGSAGGGGASTQEVGSCKESCNKMKFFGCNSAEEQAACYDDCGAATSAQIELFTACAGTSICDPACRTNIKPKPAPGAPAPTGGGATSSSCETACDKLVGCSFVKVGEKGACVEACQKDAYQYQIDCINNNACDKMQSACGGGSSGGSSSGGSSSGGSGSDESFSIGQCQSTCDQLLFMDCIDAAGQSACRAKCSAVAAAKRDTFSSCVGAATGQCTKANACYDALKN